MKHYIVLIAVMVFSFSTAQDCSAILLGELKDFHDGSVISEASIYIKTLNRSTISDENGKFRFDELCDGVIELVISHIACETKTVQVVIKGDTFKSILLEHHIENLEEVAITGRASIKQSQTAQETILKSKTLEKYSALSLGDALKEVSGVSSINTGNAIVKPMINGMHSSRLLIMTNGVRLQDQEWGIEHAPNIDINAAGQISVIKGSGALAFGGDAIGGAIIINPSPIITKDTLYGKTILGGQTNGRGYFLSSSINKSFVSGWFVNAQGTLKQNGDYNAPDYNLSNTGLKSQGLSFHTGKNSFENGFDIYYSFLNNDIGILRASHIGNISDLVNSINSQEPFIIEDFTYDINSPKQDVTHHLFKANYYKRFKEFGKVSVKYDFQHNRRFEFDVRVGSDRNKPALDLTLQTHTVNADVKLDSKANYSISFGVLGRYQNNFANPDTGVRRLIPDYDKYDFGAYITSNWSLNENLVLDGGIRYDFVRIDAKKFYQKSRWEERGYDDDFSEFIIQDLGTQYLTNPNFNYHNMSASAGIKYNLSTNSYILGNYSLTSRPPNPAELFSDGLHHSAARIELGDLRIKQEWSNRFALSYYVSSNKLEFSVEGFYNRISNFIYLEPVGIEQTIRGAFPVWDYLQTSAELYGLDLSASYAITDQFNWSNKTAFIQGNDLDMKRPLIDIPAFSTLNTMDFTIPNWYQLKLGLTSDWVFEQKQFPDNNFNAFIPTTGETVLVDISTPPPAYHLVHFNANTNFELTNKINLNITLSINNLFDTSYRAYLNRLRYFADDLGRNVMLQLQLNY